MIADAIPPLPPEVAVHFLPTLYVLLFIIAVAGLLVGGLWKGFTWLRKQIDAQIAAQVPLSVDHSVRKALNGHVEDERAWKEELRSQWVETNRRIDGILAEIVGLVREVLQESRKH